MLILDNNPMENGVKPDAKYLVKRYDAEGAEKYKDRLVDDILRFTFTPDSNDDSFAGNRSGESMKYKLMASDNLRAEQERMFKTGIMRRLRLVSNIWSIRG
ncbi:phage portal protein, partial [Escherichia coli]|nr:phage portal protein [Escherichia coli]